MPIFRYRCPRCGREQKLLVARYDAAPHCPHCGASDLAKLPSSFAAPARSAAAGCPAAADCPSAGGHHCCGDGCGCGGH